MGNSISRKQLLSDIGRVAELVNGSPTYAEYRNHGEYSPQTAVRKFSSWNSALKAAGNDLNNRSKPNRETLLNVLRENADNGIAPRHDSIDYSVASYQTEFYSYWAACIRAGLKPRDRRPLSPESFKRYHSAAIDSPPEQAIVGLLFAFTGLTPRLAVRLSESWRADRRDKHIIKVPKDLTGTDKTWMFRVPTTWMDPLTGTRQQTHLPELLDWYWNNQSTPIENSHGTITAKIKLIAQTAGLNDQRQKVQFRQWEEVPQVRAQDLRVTHGINLARRGIKTGAIEQRLGIEYTGFRADVQEFFIWLDEHEDDFSHPDYDPPDIVLDPVDPDSPTE